MILFDNKNIEINFNYIINKNPYDFFFHGIELKSKIKYFMMKIIINKQCYLILNIKFQNILFEIFIQ